MIFQFNLLMALYGITAIILALVGLYYWKRRDTHGGFYLSMLMFATMIWAIAEMFEMAAVGVPLKIAFGKLSYIGIVAVGPLWLLFNLAYSRRRRNPVQRGDVLALWIIPAIIIALVFTNEWHHLVWANITPVSPAPGAVLIYDHGIAAYANLIYGYTLMLAGTLILLKTSLRTFQQYAPMTLALILGSIVPLAGNFTYVIVTNASSGFDPTPFTIAIMGLLYAGSTFYLKLFDLVPVARERLISDMVDGIIVIDDRDRVIDVNATAIAFIGPGPAIGYPLDTVLARWPELRDCCRQPEGIREVGMGGRWLEVRVSPILDYGEVTGRLVVARDITKRKRAEDALKDSEDRFRSIIEQTNNGIILVDEKGTIALYNHSAETIIGLGAGDVVGRPIWEVMHRVALAQLRTPEYLGTLKSGFARYFEKSFASGPIAQRLDIEREDGTRRITQNTIFPIKNTKGSLLGVIIQDFTEQALAEKQLEAERQELKRSNEELEQFAFIASHDLQEPLRMVNSYVRLLERKYKGQLDEKADQYIAYAADGTQRMQYMIKDLLKYSRVSGKGPAAVPVDLGVVMTGALADLDAAITDSKAEIRYEALPWVMGDEGQIRQVLENLIGNGIKFHKNGEPPVVTVRTARRDGFWEIAVADNGIGIDPQYFKKLFVIFQRLHTREEYAGTGIGLAICKKIVERYGGGIRVESAPGEGTTFRFTLPAAEPGAGMAESVSGDGV